MFAHDLCHSQIEYLRNSVDLDRKDRAKRYHKSSIVNIQFRLVHVRVIGYLKKIVTAYFPLLISRTEG
jgi:hypothetical protein